MMQYLNGEWANKAVVRSAAHYRKVQNKRSDVASYSRREMRRMFERIRRRNNA